MTSLNRGSAVDRYIRGQGHCVHKLKAKDSTGRWAVYFVYVAAAKEKAFLMAIEGDGVIDLDSVGHVLDSCYGEVVTPELKERLLTRYGFTV
jgi:hypothetical protein